MTPALTRRPRAALFLTSVAAAALLAAQAAAQPAVRLEIAAGPLDDALVALANQAHEQLLFTPGLVAGQKAPALSGEFTVEQAVARLAPGLEVHRVSPNTIALRRAPPARLPAAVQEPPTSRPFAADPPPLATAPAPAAGVAAAPAAPAGATVEAIEVTGTHIRGAPPASPLRVLSRVDLERTAQTTVAEALRSLPENFSGVANEGNSLTGADGVGRNSAFGTSLNLRGLGNGATLVLINGHRFAGSGTFGDFVDISTIPSAAVERVEVLLDGASAAYGSDAVGGVVNIIMRQTYEGAETRVLGGTATRGGASEVQVSQLLGHRWDGGGVLLSYDFRQRGRVTDASRPFAASADLRPFGGSDFRSINSFPGNILVTNPATNALVPGFAIPAGQTGVGLKPSDLLAGVINFGNPRQGEDLLPAQTLHAVYLAADQAVGERLELSADARYSRRSYDAAQNLPTTNLTVGRANPFYVAPTGAATETIAYSFAGQIPNPVQSGSVETVGFTADAKLQLWGDWRADAYATLAQETDRVRLTGFTDSLFLNEALGNIADRPDTAFSTAANGFFNPFAGVGGANSPAILAFIASGGTFGRSRDRVTSLNLQTDGTVWRLPGGPLKLAIGAQVRREALIRNGVNMLSTPGPVPFSTLTDVSRRVSALYAEARIPLVGPDNALPWARRLELTAAGRTERYQTIGSTTNPTFGVLWEPAEGLHVRATYSRSFRAPALRELYDPAALNPVTLSQGVARVRTLELTGGNTGLKPETATSWTAGIDYQPPGSALQLSLTGFDVRFENRIDRPASVNIANALTDPTLSPFVQHISPGTNPADLAIINAALASLPFVSGTQGFAPTDYGAIVDVRYVNTGMLHVTGMDVSGSYALDAGPGRLTVGGAATYLATYDLQFTPTSPVVSRVNVANFPLRFHSRLTADWTRERLTLGGAFNYLGAYHDTLGQRIGDQHTLDLQARLAPAGHGPLKGVAVLLNIRNLFDSDPPFWNNSAGFAYDPANADPIGRFVSLQLTRTW